MATLASGHTHETNIRIAELSVFAQTVAVFQAWFQLVVHKLVPLGRHFSQAHVGSPPQRIRVKKLEPIGPTLFIDLCLVI